MTKLRAIKEVLVLHRKQRDVAIQFGMHRNTLGSLLILFESQAPPELKEKLQQGVHMNAEEIRTL
jgi:transposase-like protein